MKRERIRVRSVPHALCRLCGQPKASAFRCIATGELHASESPGVEPVVVVPLEAEACAVIARREQVARTTVLDMEAEEMALLYALRCDELRHLRGLGVAPLQSEPCPSADVQTNEAKPWMTPAKEQYFVSPRPARYGQCRRPRVLARLESLGLEARYAIETPVSDYVASDRAVNSPAECDPSPDERAERLARQRAERPKPQHWRQELLDTETIARSRIELDAVTGAKVFVSDSLYQRHAATAVELGNEFQHATAPIHDDCLRGVRFLAATQALAASEERARRAAFASERTSRQALYEVFCGGVDDMRSVDACFRASAGTATDDEAGISTNTWVLVDNVIELALSARE